GSQTGTSIAGSPRSVLTRQRRPSVPCSSPRENSRGGNGDVPAAGLWGGQFCPSAQLSRGQQGSRFGDARGSDLFGHFHRRVRHVHSGQLVHGEQGEWGYAAVS